MYLKRILVVTLMMIFGLSFCSCKKRIMPKEEELNDSFATATIHSLNKPIKGKLDRSNDLDYYRFTANKPMMIDISLSLLKGVNHSLKIYQKNDQGNLLKWVDDYRKSAEERIINLSVRPGTFYVVVGHGDRDKPYRNQNDFYTLLVQEHLGEYEEVEPNDTALQATPLMLNHAICGYYSPALNRLTKLTGEKSFEESDWYKIEFNTSEPFLLDINLSAVAGVDTELSFYDQSLNLLNTSNLHVVGEGETLVDQGVKMAGTYFIKVSAKNLAVNTDSPYQLLVTTKIFDSSLELETNDSFVDANLKEIGEIKGKINTADDQDFFLIKEIDSGIYFVKLTPPGDADLKLELYSLTKEKIVELDTGKMGGEEFYLNLPLGGDVYAKVSSTVKNSSEDYYTIQMEKTATLDYMEKEFNDNKKTANSLYQNKIVGYFSTANDIDYYRLVYPTRQKVRIKIKGVKDAVTLVSITDPLGYVLKSTEVVGLANGELVDFVDRQGYIIIKAKNSNYQDYYQIEVEEIE